MKMRKYLLLLNCLALLVILSLTSGCAKDDHLPAVSLSSPGDGSMVDSLMPTLIWGGPADASYRLLVATDSNFQNLALDASNLVETSYTIPEDKLEEGRSYFWKVLAIADDSGTWSAPWKFRTPGTDEPTGFGSLKVNAALDGVLWDGNVNFQISGPFAGVEESVPISHEDVPAGLYTITYNSGGPANTLLTAIEPAPALELNDGEALDFLLHFHSNTTAAIKINATLDGQPWSGELRYKISGPFKDADYIVPQTISNLPAGQYTLSYRDGGPEGAALQSISPSSVQKVTIGEVITFTFNFSSSEQSELLVNAKLNGATWTGPVEFSIQGPVSGTYKNMPLDLKDIPPGKYTISYKSGGPAGAKLRNISPSETIEIGKGRSGSFVLNFSTGEEAAGTVEVKATLNGTAWSGPLNFKVLGPLEFSDHQVPRTYKELPLGEYTISFKGGGPQNASLASITPAPTQQLKKDQTLVYYLNFVENTSKGKITVKATLDGQPWETAMGSGTISYSLSGPAYDAHNAIPGSFDKMPPGVYTLNLNSGGPIGAVLTGISPAPTMTLESGGSTTFTLNFSEQAKGNVSVVATIDDEPWSGQVNYILQGPYVESGSSVPASFSNAPPGQYSVQYDSGGPPQCKYIGISPSSKNLTPGGSVQFTIKFKFQSGILPDPEPMPGPIPEPEPEPIPGPLLD
jgi:hypothetical protein